MYEQAMMIHLPYNMCTHTHTHTHSHTLTHTHTHTYLYGDTSECTYMHEQVMMIHLPFNIGRPGLVRNVGTYV